MPLRGHRLGTVPVVAAVAFAAVALVACGSATNSTSTAGAPAVSSSPSADAAAEYSKALDSADRRLPKNPTETPVPATVFRKPIAAYRRFAAADAAQLSDDVAALRTALATGNRTAAEQAWRVAFARYLRLGAVYGEFGDRDTAIDGLPFSLPRGVDDPGFTGLHRIEYGLWATSVDPTTLVAAVDRLKTDVDDLHRVIPTVSLPILDYTLRIHEILEDAQRDFLSDTDVPWSHEGVLATAAAVAATDEVVGTVEGILPGDIDTAIHTDDAVLHGVLADIRAAHGGTYPTDDQLSMRERERLDGAVGALLEALQGVPGDLETAPPPAVPVLKSR